MCIYTFFFPCIYIYMYLCISVCMNKSVHMCLFVCLQTHFLICTRKHFPTFKNSYWNSSRTTNETNIIVYIDVYLSQNGQNTLWRNTFVVKTFHERETRPMIGSSGTIFYTHTFYCDRFKENIQGPPLVH